MDAEVLRHLGDPTNTAFQQQALIYFEQLKTSEEGWKQCINLLISNTCHDDRVKFFSFQVIEHYIKNQYSLASSEDQRIIREFLSQWIQIQCLTSEGEKKFLKNKAAQIFALVFVRDFLHSWPNFFTDLLQTLTLGPQAVDHYLRVLMAIYSEVTDNDIPYSPEELGRNKEIKDNMRIADVAKLVSSWYQILERYQNSHPEVAGQCLQVIGSYISWIDISLIANDHFVPLLVQQLVKPNVREDAADCLLSIVSKGMEPAIKAKLVESLCTVLLSFGVLKPQEGDETDFSVKIGNLLNRMGVNLIECHNKLQKLGCKSDAAAVKLAIDSKIDALLEFLGNEYDDVSASVIEFAKEYIHMMKSKVPVAEVDRTHVCQLLTVTANKMKYDETYNFSVEGEDEADFIEYRKQLKIVYENLAFFDKTMVLEYTETLLTGTLSQWQTLNFSEVEVAMYFLYIVAEAVPVSSGLQLKEPLRNMMQALLTSEVSRHPHPAIKLLFFETVVRYDKFFNTETEHIGTILTTFLDERGMRNESCKVRSRCSYLFAKLIKDLKSHMQSYTKLVLQMMKDLLIPSVPSASNGMIYSMLSDDDQLYVYEACGILIVSGNFPLQEKEMYLRELLSPLLNKFTLMVGQLIVESNEKRREALCRCLCHMLALTSRTSKAFSNHHNMKSHGCVQVYLDALRIFLSCLQVLHPNQQRELQTAVRQYLHRMVVCLEEDLLPYIPMASEGLLKSSDISSFQEYVPLITQIITKFKKEIVPFLQLAFMPIVKGIVHALASPIDENDEQAYRDMQSLQRNYFLFLAAIVTNNVTEVLEAQESQALKDIMTSIISGAVDSPDPVVQKTCFSILRRLVILWGSKDIPNGFIEFMYKNIVPACFLAPMKNSFNLEDYQTTVTLKEISFCMRMVYKQRGDELIIYLNQWLPTLNFNVAMINEYCEALKSDDEFKSFLLPFFERIRT